MPDDKAGPRHVAPYRVRFDEAGPDGLLRTSGLLRYAQDVAWRHSEAMGFDRAWYAERGLSWVVRAAVLEVTRPIVLGTTLEIATTVLGFQRIWARRRAACRLPDGAPAATIDTDWVLIDGRGRLARLPPEIAQRFPAPFIDDSIARVTLADPPPDARTSRFRVRPHELDPMNHVNNAVYVDWLEETLGAAGPDPGAGLGHLPRRIRLEYAAAARPGAAVEARAWRIESGWACRVTTRDGATLVRAIIGS